MVLTNNLKVGIVGCGYISRKHYEAILKNGDEVVALVDVNVSNAEKLAKEFGIRRNVEIATKITDVYLDNVDAFVVCTPNAFLAENALFAIENGKHVLVEKPGGMNSRELKHLAKLAEDKVVVHVGYNMRFHPSIRMAKQMIEDNAIGKIMFLSEKYGHGARDSYNKEWRADPKIAGKGVSMELGSHLINLSQWIMPSSRWTAISKLATLFWSMPVEDNAFIIMENENENIAFIHASCTEWNNTFEFEIYGTEGKIECDGLGKSYGKEQIIYSKMNMGKKSTITKQTFDCDDSWWLQWEEFVGAINGEETFYSCDLYDAYSTMKTIETL